MARIDRLKRALGGAIKRKKPSKAATIIVGQGLAVGRVLDYGCGFGFDADYYAWDAYDPYYRPTKPEGKFNTIICISVINALTRNNRNKVYSYINGLLAPGGMAYFAVPRDIPKTGKLGMHHSIQNYVVLTLPSIYRDDALEIYRWANGIEFKDKTKDFISLRDKRKDR